MKISSLKYSLIFVLSLAILLLPSSGYAQKANWKKIDLDFCSFLAPSDLSLVSTYAKDSQIWLFQSGELELTIDLGLYSGKPEGDKEELGYVDRRVSVDNKKASIVRFKYREPKSDGFDYVTAIYFPKVGDKYTKLSFVAHSKTPEHQKQAEEIFLSIDLK